MSYLVTGDNEIQIQCISSDGVGQASIVLNNAGSSLVTNRCSRINGVCDSNGNLNPQSITVSVESNNCNILDNITQVNASLGAEITINLNTETL